VSTSTESFAHKAAKNYIYDWMQEGRVAGNYERFCSIRFPIGHPVWVYREYPLVVGDGVIFGHDLAWDQVETNRGDNRPFMDSPAIGELKKFGLFPSTILDIAWGIPGACKGAIEIHHKHAVTPKKYEFCLKTLRLDSLLEFPASWILAQVAVPRYIPEEFWLIRNGEATGNFGKEQRAEWLASPQRSEPRRRKERTTPRATFGRSPYASKRRS
jgi:hypothetical protein